MDILDNNLTYCGEITGKTSQFKYQCDKETNEFIMYINISLSDYEALSIQKKSDNNGQVGVYPFRKLSYS
jgi:hypothetical protein